MATNYTRGAAFERKVASDLEGYGYVTVRSAGSHSPADVIAMRYGTIAAVQCKRNGRLDPDEWNEFLDFCENAGALPVVAMIGPNGRGVTYNVITSRKDGAGRQPWEQWFPQREREQE